MLAFVIFAVTFVVALIIAVLYLSPGSKKPTSIPGADPTSKEDGNLGDIGKAGSLHQFLLDLHSKFGPISAFWWGTQYVVSIASAKLFKKHQHIFDRPPALFMLFEPLIGRKCIQYANGTEGQAKRSAYDKCLTHDAIKHYYGSFQEVANELGKRWSAMHEDDHVPLCQSMSSFALKAVLVALFGEFMKNDKEVLEFKTHYDAVWSEMEMRISQPPTEAREKAFDTSKAFLNGVIARVVEHRKDNPPQHGEELLLDVILDYSSDPEYQHSEALVFTVGGYHTTANVLAWGFYFLATHPEVQDKVVAEIKAKLGAEDVDHTNIGDLVYLRQFIDETMRCAVVAPWAARFESVDSELGGHMLPKNTPVIHGLGVALKDETTWPLPNKFDPDRFSEENSKKRPSTWFSPFGIGGKRVCPGHRFAYAEASVCFVTLLRKFKVNMVEGQVVTPNYGFVTHPSQEVWVTLSKR